MTARGDRSLTTARGTDRGEARRLAHLWSPVTPRCSGVGWEARCPGAVAGTRHGFACGFRVWGALQSDRSLGLHACGSSCVHPILGNVLFAFLCSAHMGNEPPTRFRGQPTLHHPPSPTHGVIHPPTHPRTPHHTHVTCPSPPNVHACVCRLALQLSDTAGGTSVMYACKHGLVALAERLMRVGGGVCWGVYWGGGGACWGVCWGCTRTLPRRVGPHMHALHTHAANVDCFVWCVMSAA